MGNPPSETNSSQPPEIGFSDGVRTLISFLIFAHFFALAAAVLSNFGPVSELRSQLSASFLRSYTYLLHMDIGYNFHLVDASELDAPLSLELDVAAAANTGGETIYFPSALSPNLRAGRYRQLMLNVDLMQGDDESEADLPKLIAQRLLAEREISSGKHHLRLRRHLLAAREAWNGDEPPNLFAADRFRDVYEADVNFFRGNLVLIKQEAAAESAIVRPSKP